MGLTGARRLAAASLLLALAACERAEPIADAAADVAPDTVTAAEAALPTVRAGALTLSRVVAPAPIADAPMAVYVAIANAGPAADTLLGATVAGAASATLHETAGGAMRPVARVPIAAGDSAALRPGGLHLMVEGLAPAPAAGDSVRVTLRFARAGDVAVVAPVVSYAALEGLLGGGDPHAGH